MKSSWPDSLLISQSDALLFGKPEEGKRVFFCRIKSEIIEGRFLFAVFLFLL